MNLLKNETESTAPVAAPGSTLEILEEQKLFLENVDSEGTVLRSNHVSNYVSLSGTLNQDTEKMIAQLDTAIQSGRIRPERFRRL